MKPHIIRIHGIWTCRCYIWGRVVRIALRPVGEGYRPDEALRDWVSQQ